MSFNINDPVHVTVGARRLEGVVAHMHDNDRLGIRLTGSSVGLGTHDGEGLFAAPPNSGLWANASDVTARSLTRLEELRLRRELASSAPTPAAASTTTSTTAASTSSRTTTAATTSTGASGLTTPRSRATTTSTTASTPSTRSKLEEIRARREALQSKKEETTSSDVPPTAAAESNTNTSANTSGDTTDANNARNDELVASLRQQLAKAEQEKSRLQEEAQGLRTQVTNLQADQTASQETLESLKAELQTLQTDYERAVQAKSSSSSSNTRQALPPEVQDEMNNLHRAKSEAEDNYEMARQRILQLEASVTASEHQQSADSDELVKLRAQVRALQAQQQDDKGTAADTAQYKERAMRQAQEAAHQRALQAWQEEKMELEASIEELVLDKEQLSEENQNLYDRLEEMKLDIETAQMESEELRLELEDVRQASAGVPMTSTGSSAPGGDGASPEQEEKMEVLSFQNARLREALIRLREQSSLEKMTLQKELRQAEKQSQAVEELTAQVLQLKQAKARHEEEVNLLKDMVEQGAAFESMVEDLSDRVLSLEEDIAALQTTIREMEEAAELSAEVEEVQTEEIKALLRDVDGRDAIIRNLEEAIKMQRRREEDFRRTVGNYRLTVETLKQEKEALLQVQQGAFGEKSEMMATSQKALARAAQLVTDAANLRKEKAQAAAKAMDHIVYKHLSERLERLAPSTVVAPEVGAMKGELYACKVAGKASQSLAGIAESLTKHIQPALPPDEAVEAGSSTAATLKLSDDARQEVTTMLHQVEMAHVLVTASADLRRFVAGGQWPDLVTPEVSMEIGAILGHSVTELDSMLGGVFRSLKEEGALTPEQSNLGALQQMVNSTIQRISAEVDREDATLIEKTWNPPGWSLLREASMAKFSCLGAAAALSIVHADGDAQANTLAKLYNRVEQAASQANNICLRLTSLDIQNSNVVSEIEEGVTNWKNCSTGMVESVRTLLLSSEGDLNACSCCVDDALKEMAKLLQILRSAKLNPTDDESFHALSPEVHDPWDRISMLVRSIRAIDGDHEDVNYLIRARDIERHLEQAIDKEPKLEQAEAKVSSLEKTLSSRSKEIAMQNTRLSELERVIAKSSTGSMGRVISSDVKSVEEYNSLREENRVLSEAMDVLQRQVDEYENEIRVLKDFKSPKRAGASRGTPRRAMTSVGDFGSPQNRLIVEEKQTNTGVLEATLFRPALQQALEESAHWKSTAAASLLDLPPLPILVSEESKTKDETTDDLYQLNTALADYRLELASIKLVDLTRKDKTPREQLRENKARSLSATMNLESVYRRCRGKVM
eukprot:scaffold6506_cov171-Amphora_coffeaeformis.AAC.5